MILDLTASLLDEHQLLLELKKAFDEGDEVQYIRINSATALNLNQSPAMVYNDPHTYYQSVFSSPSVVVVSEQELASSER